MTIDNLLALQPALMGQKVDLSALSSDLVAVKDDPAAFTQALLNQLQTLTGTAPAVTENAAVPAETTPKDAKSVLAVLDQLRAFLGQPPLSQEDGPGNVSPFAVDTKGQGGKSVPVESLSARQRQFFSQDQPLSAEHMAELVAQLALLPVNQTTSPVAEAAAAADATKSPAAPELLALSGVPVNVVPAMPVVAVQAEVVTTSGMVASERGALQLAVASAQTPKVATQTPEVSASTAPGMAKTAPLHPLDSAPRPLVIAEEESEDDAFAPLVKLPPRLQIKAEPARGTSASDPVAGNAMPTVNEFSSTPTELQPEQGFSAQQGAAPSENAEIADAGAPAGTDQAREAVAGHTTPIAADIQRWFQPASVPDSVMAATMGQSAPAERADMPAAVPTSSPIEGSSPLSLPSVPGALGAPKDLLKIVAAGPNKAGGEEFAAAILDVKPEVPLNGGLHNAADVRAITPMAQEMAALQSRPAEQVVPPKEMAPALTLERPFGHPQWADDFGERIHWVSGQGLQAAELRLNPAHLGPVEVRINMNQDQASIQFVAHHAAVREAIETAIPKLREMLGTQQVNLADVTVSQQPFNDPQRDSRGAPLGYEQQQSGRSGRDYQGDALEPAKLYPEGEQPISRKESRSLLSLYA